MARNRIIWLLVILVLTASVMPAYAGTLDPKKLIKIAKHYVGYPYRYGGASPYGFDCSGFAVYVFGRLGKSIPRNEWQMYAAGEPIKKKDLRMGDILFFVNTYRAGLSHIAIYMENGKFVHASYAPLGVRIDSLSHPYYASRYYSACRIPEFKQPKISQKVK